MSVITNPLAWSGYVSFFVPSGTPAFWWQALAADNRWWFYNNTGSFGGGSNTRITWLPMVEAIPAGTLTFAWEITEVRVTGTFQFQYRINGGAETTIDLGNSLGSGTVDVTIPVGMTAFSWSIETSSGAIDLMYDGKCAVGDPAQSTIYYDLVRADETSIKPGAMLNFYVSPSATVRQLAYADKALTVPFDNPLESTADGRFPVIYYGSTAYRIIMTDVDGNVLADASPYDGSNLPGREPFAPRDAAGDPLPLAVATFWLSNTTILSPVGVHTADANGVFTPIPLDTAVEYRVRLEDANGVMVYDIEYQHDP